MPRKSTEDMIHLTTYVPKSIVDEARARGINLSRAAADGLALAIRREDKLKEIIDEETPEEVPNKTE